MSTRKIKIYSSVGKTGEIEAANKEELKAKLKELNIKMDGMAFSEVNNDTEISFDNKQELPEGDLQLYILPAKTKSGY